MKYILSAGLLASLLVLPLGNAVAGWQSNPGTQCKPISSSHSYGVYNWSGIKNTGSRSAWFVCPVRKDDQANDGTHYIVLHHPTSRTTRCYYNRQTWNSAGTTAWRNASTTGSGTRTLAIPAPTGSYGAYDSNIALCYMAPGTSLRQSTWLK